jgi:hypothetical protein
MAVSFMVGDHGGEVRRTGTPLLAMRARRGAAGCGSAFTFGFMSGSPRCVEIKDNQDEEDNKADVAEAMNVPKRSVVSGTVGFCLFGGGSEMHVGAAVTETGRVEAGAADTVYVEPL